MKNDLEDAANKHWLEICCNEDNSNYDTFKAGANWQKEKDKAVIDNLVENLERILDRIKENDLIPCFPSAYDRAKQLLAQLNNQQ